MKDCSCFANCFLAVFALLFLLSVPSGSLADEMVDIDTAWTKYSEFENSIISSQSQATQQFEAEKAILYDQRDKIIEKLKPAPKDQFETNAQYEARVTDTENKIEQIRQEFEINIDTLRQNLLNPEATGTTAVKEKIAALLEKSYPVKPDIVEFKLYQFDADHLQYTVYFEIIGGLCQDGYYGKISVDTATAKQYHADPGGLKIELSAKLPGCSIHFMEGVVIDTRQNKSYKFEDLTYAERFKWIGANAIWDRVYDLEWVKADKKGTFQYAQKIIAMNYQDSNGFGRYRLPKMNELETLHDKSISFEDKTTAAVYKPFDQWVSIQQESFSQGANECVWSSQTTQPQYGLDNKPILKAWMYCYHYHAKSGYMSKKVREIDLQNWHASLHPIFLVRSANPENNRINLTNPDLNKKPEPEMPERKEYDPYAERTVKIVGQYRITKCGSIIDTKSGREWYVDPEKARGKQKDEIEWAKSLTVCGAKWKAPDITTLTALFQNSEDLSELLKILRLKNNSIIWSGTTGFAPKNCYDLGSSKQVANYGGSWEQIIALRVIDTK